MGPESRTCQNCKQEFRIEPEDFTFYEKIKVPPPTWCPDCRLQRRLAFRNDRSLYKRKCDLCGLDLFSIYHPEATFPVYCKDCWYSDKWSAFDYGKDADFSRPFFDQVGELLAAVPRMAVFQTNCTNSPFANSIVESKNVYLAYSIVKSENIMFSKSIDTSSQVLDSIESFNLERCYENINSERNYNSHFMHMAEDCADSWFLYDCVNCRNCFMSSNLQNRQYVMRNIQYSREDYLAELAKMGPGSALAIEKLKKEFVELQKKALHKFADIKKSTNSSGNHVQNARNARYCFETYDVENIKYCYRVLDMKDMMDVCYGGWSELRYEHITGGDHGFNMRFGFSSLPNLRNAEYSAFCAASTNIFGCVGVNKGEYVVLNKRYGEEEFQELRSRIIKHMQDMPYVDEKGRVWKYGEFFPLHLAAPFGYNETQAEEMFPLTKEEALAMGYAWRDVEAKNHVASKQSQDLPDDIKDVEDAILGETIGCAHAGTCSHQCTVAFRMIPDELQFYRQHGLPLPHLCPNCRHYARLAQMEPLKVWDDKCNCAGGASDDGNWRNTAAHFHGAEHCPNAFKTPHAPGHKETLYCEKCYQAEVA